MAQTLRVAHAKFHSEVHRGWDLLAGKMLSPAELDAMGFHITASGRTSHAHIIPMALTPIIDQFNQRIYEGDICEMGVIVNKNVGMVRTRGWMGWDPPGNCYTIFYEMNQPLLKAGMKMTATGITKVGNIFENPDKLTDEQNVPVEIIAGRPPEAPKQPPTPRKPRKSVLVSECCNSPVESETFFDESLAGGVKVMHSCKKCGKACGAKVHA
jgi:hypothetical protein